MTGMGLHLPITDLFHTNMNNLFMEISDVIKTMRRLLLILILRYGWLSLCWNSFYIWFLKLKKKNQFSRTTCLVLKVVYNAKWRSEIFKKFKNTRYKVKVDQQTPQILEGVHWHGYVRACLLGCFFANLVQW